MRLRIVLPVWFVSLCGVAAALTIAAARRPSADLDQLRVHETGFDLVRKDSDPLLIRPEKWQPLPAMRADFDLSGDVELADGAVFDLVLRRMEPHPVQAQNVPFHGRFTVLRLSTGGEGPAWRLPADALLGPPHGVKVAPGLSATLTIQARGRTLTANVAGKVLPPFEATDEIGSLALIARGAPVAVTRLQIQTVASPAGVPLWAVGLAIGFVVAGLGLAVRASLRRRILSGALLALVPVLAARHALAPLPPLAQAEPRDELLLLCGSAAFAFVPLATGARRLLVLLVALVLAGTTAERLRQHLVARFPDTAPLDGLFGPAAGAEVVESLAQCIRGPGGLHLPDPKQRFVLLLGGQLLWQRAPRQGAAPEPVETLLQGELRAQAADVEVAALPTFDGYSAQQWRLYRTCFQGYRPKVVVFGVPREEDADDPATGQRRSTPAALEALLPTIEAELRQSGAALVLVADQGLEANLHAVLQRAKARGVPCYEIAPDADAAAIARGLAGLVAAQLR